MVLISFTSGLTAAGLMTNQAHTFLLDDHQLNSLRKQVATLLISLSLLVIQKIRFERRLKNTNFSFLVPSTDQYSNVIVQAMTGALITYNTSMSCESGLLSFSACFDGCLTFNMAENVCTNTTESPYDIFYNGVQTWCIAPTGKLTIF
jgi:hypothetical protein